MQLTYVLTELGTGLKRNISMTVAVVVTLFVSLTLVGLGLLLNAQADKAEQFWGDRLQITVFLCTDNSPGAALHRRQGHARAARRRTPGARGEPGGRVLPVRDQRPGLREVEGRLLLR